MALRLSLLLLCAAAVAAVGRAPALAQGVHVRERFFEQNTSEPLPADSLYIRYIKLRSERLSSFHGRPVYLRAGVILPRDFHVETARRYPLWVRTGGYGSRYTFVRELGSPIHGPGAGLPRFVSVCLDGAGPYGDPSQVNSANNGPYGDAITQELIPHIERQFRCIGRPSARFLSGTSTGGWASLALQVFYPNYFNGAYAFWPDPVDFRALGRINVYQDTNAYRDAVGTFRPGKRDEDGDVTTVWAQCRYEEKAGDGSFTLSGKQWGAWNAVYSPRGPDGLPVPLWDSKTGQIDRAVVEQWKKYDLRLVLQQNWRTLGPRLRSRLHIWVGEQDDYFLNEAVHLLDNALSRGNPTMTGTIFYDPEGGHGGFEIPGTQDLLERMEQAMLAEREDRPVPAAPPGGVQGLAE